jgi:hypothetical protein
MNVVTLDQTQSTGLYRMPIDVVISTAPPGTAARGPAPVRTVRVVIDQAHTVQTIPLDAEPAGVQLDPQSWVTLVQSTFIKQ